MLDIVYRDTVGSAARCAHKGIPLYGIVPKKLGPLVRGSRYVEITLEFIAISGFSTARDAPQAQEFIQFLCLRIGTE